MGGGGSWGTGGGDGGRGGAVVRKNPGHRSLRGALIRKVHVRFYPRFEGVSLFRPITEGFALLRRQLVVLVFVYMHAHTGINSGRPTGASC